MSTAEINFAIDAKARRFAIETPLSFADAQHWMRSAYGLLGDRALSITDARVLQIVATHPDVFEAGADE